MRWNKKDLKSQVFFLLEHSLSCRIFPSLFSPHQREIHVDSGEGSSEKASTENPPDSDHTDSPKRRFHAAVSLCHARRPDITGRILHRLTLPVIRTPLFSQRKIRKASATVFKKFHQTTAPERTIIKKRGRSSPCATHDIKYGFYDNSSPAYRLNRTNSKKIFKRDLFFIKEKHIFVIVEHQTIYKNFNI